jgi:hypothetical protein
MVMNSLPIEKKKIIPNSTLIIMTIHFIIFIIECFIAQLAHLGTNIVFLIFCTE